MIKIIKQNFFIMSLLVIFIPIIFFMTHLKLRLDFLSFFAAARAYQHYSNPFYNLYAFFLSQPFELPCSLATPFFLWLISPLTYLNIHYALLIFSALSLISSCIAIYLTLQIFFPQGAIGKKRWCYFFICFGLYSTIINFSIGQIGSFLFLFIISGYYFYLKEQDFLSGFFWGLIIAIKLFPALLLFFAWSERRYRVLGWTILISLLAFSIPLLSHGLHIYQLYGALMPRLLWYGHIWNASLYGFLFRFISLTHPAVGLAIIRPLYLVLFAAFLFWYLRKISDKKMHSHQRFSISMTMMLFLSPFGWLYYFSLLIIPFTYLWIHDIDNTNPKPFVTLLWFIAFFLLNIPFQTTPSFKTLQEASPWGLYSVYFYGLNILLFIITRTPTSRIMRENIPAYAPTYRFLFAIILTFGWILPVRELYFTQGEERSQERVKIEQGGLTKI